ncbi:MAG TPA: hypothetical protein VMY37_19670, partial [Thermoguttaceae bacterium]|nr:hypothetical protein [Thermoguttaceae bacterium]
LGQVCDCLVVLAFVRPDSAAVVISFGEAGLQPDGLVAVRNGLVVLALLAPDNATLVVGAGVRGLYP